MQRSTSNSDFSVRMVEHVPFQTMKIYICTMIDRRNQPRAENVFHVQEVLTKLQSLQLESMRRNFHVKLPYITIDKISGIVLGPYGRKFQSCNVFAFQRTTSGWRHMYSYFAMFAMFDSLFLCKIYLRTFYILHLPNSGQNFSQ